ncbi:MAG: FAD-dependent thymidylate synthase [Limnochordales bacterium]|nr:FAD-dependent thymidylate synthase [Limnochordales bacterium]
MAILHEPQVELIAWTGFAKPEGYPWTTDSERDGERLIEFAGRMCYQSWDNPSGRTNREYIQNLLKQGHLSVLEHAQASFAISGISRSCSHELVRHRHFSFSQLSQRYVAEDEANFVEPSVIASDPRTHAIFVEAVEAARQAYIRLNELLEEKFSHIPSRVERRKLARQAARAVLPNATETKLVMTGNLRAWRHFLRLRASRHAEAEIRKVALLIYQKLLELAPAVFSDFQVTCGADGVTELITPYTAD